MGLKMTLGDSFERFMATYIRKTPVEEHVKVEDNLPFKPSDFSSESTKFSMTIDGKSITPMMRRTVALTSPFYMKGLRKKCRDTFRAGWSYDKDGKKPTVVEQALLDAFNKRTNIYAFMEKMKQDAHIYGDGICLIVFSGDQNKEKPDLSLPVNPAAIPYTLKRLNPEYITSFKYKNESYKKTGVQHLIYANTAMGEPEVFIHPDRVLMFKETDFAFSSFGVSDIDILRHVISSQADIDIATGEILKWFSYGVIHWTRDGAGENSMKTMRKIAEKHPHIYIGNEKDKLNILNPESIDPAPFYDYVIMAIAAVLVMPTHVLKGVEIGQSTGAEAGYADYYKDIRDSQELIYKPNLEKLYKMLFKSFFTDREFDYEIMFNPMYVGEMAEAEVDAKRSATAVNLKAGGIIDVEESRKYMNEGHIYLNPEKEIIVEIPIQPEKDPVKPNPRTEMAVPKKDKLDRSADNKLKNSDEMVDVFSLSDGEREELLQTKRIKTLEEKTAELKNKVNRMKM
jgi:hypothetical protein